MKIQYASDLHIEFHQNRDYLREHPLLPVGDILVLGGDIIPFSILERHRDFVSFFADNFETTYWLPGNHEYYKSDISAKSGYLYEAVRSNVFLVNNTSVNLGNAKLVFSTLWSKIKQENAEYVEQEMMDFKLINDKGNPLTAGLFNQLHGECMNFLKRELSEKFTGKTIVFTHYVPTLKYYPEPYKDNILTAAFAVELSDWITTTGVDYWVYGHHHFNAREFKIGNAVMLTNQLGYVMWNEQYGFQPDKYIRV